MIHSIRTVMLSAMFGIAASAGAAESPAAVAESAKPLTPQQLQIVRAAGRSVLDARRGATEEPDVTALRESLHSLRKAVDESLSAKSGSIVIEPNSPRATRRDAPANASDSSVRARWSELKARRLELQARATQPGSLRARMERLSTTAANLEQETERALASTGRDRIDRLARLRERLEPRVLEERINSDLLAVGSGLEQQTPTLITITKHR